MIDSDVLIDFANLIPEALAALRSWVADESDEVGITVVQISELSSGINPKASDSARLLVRTLRMWPISHDAAWDAGRERYDLARRGIQIGIPDALIAAVTREREAVLVTNNVKDFRHSGIDLLPLR